MLFRSLLTRPLMILSVKLGPAGRECTAIPVDAGDRLEVEYVHSMYGVRQTEVFSVGPEPSFRLEKVLFGSLAAALYYEPEPASGITFQDGFWAIRGDGKHYPILRFRVSTTSHHTLRIRGQTVDLMSLSAGTDGLTWMAIERRTRLASLFAALRRTIPSG